MKRIFSCIVMLLITSQCAIIETEASEGYYHLDNKTNFELHITAWSSSTQQAELIADVVGSQSTELIFKAIEGTGGHLYPSNFFYRFSVKALIDSKDSILYQGVKDEDWILRDSTLTNGFHIYLTID